MCSDIQKTNTLFYDNYVIDQYKNHTNISGRKAGMRSDLERKIFCDDFKK